MRLLISARVEKCGCPRLTAMQTRTSRRADSVADRLPHALHCASIALTPQAPQYRSSMPRGPSHRLCRRDPWLSFTRPQLAPLIGKRRAYRTHTHSVPILHARLPERSARGLRCSLYAASFAVHEPRALLLGELRVRSCLKFCKDACKIRTSGQSSGQAVRFVLASLLEASGLTHLLVSVQARSKTSPPVKYKATGRNALTSV